jgi:anti-sigma factor RsiW
MRVRCHVPGARFHLEHLFARRRLSVYVDDELPPGEHRRVRRHVAECEECRSVERSLRALLGGLRGLAGRKPRGIADSVVERVRDAGRLELERARRR